MNYKQTAQQIVDAIGGKENVAHLEHCSTRLRFTLNNSSIPDTDVINMIPGVLNVVKGAQFQVVIGNEVVEVYDEIVQLIGTPTQNTSSSPSFEWNNLGNVALDYLVSIFQPLVPAIAGGGMIKALLAFLAWIGVVSSKDQLYVIFNTIGDAPLYFLPLLVAITTARKLKVNQLVAVSIVAATLTPNLIKIITSTEGVLFGFGIQNISYQYQVFPAILTVFAYAVFEKFFTKYTPKAIRIFFVPMISMLLTVPLTLLILGPLGYNIGVFISSIVLWLYSTLGWVAVGVLAAILPFMVSTGMHKAMLPYATAQIGSALKESLYMPASLAHNIAESGAAFAVAFKTKNATLRSTAISAGTSALFGITEPALYGITLLHRPVLYAVMAGSLLSGLFLGFMVVEAFVLVGPGLASMPMFVPIEGIASTPNNFMNAWIGLVLSFGISFVAAFFLFKDTEVEPTNEQSVSAPSSNQVFTSPISQGEVVELSSVSDAVFSSKAMGDGIALRSTDGKLYAPANGHIKMVYATKHAIGFQTDTGFEVLFHIGIDTVQLEGKYFTVHVTEGQVVEAGDLLVSFDVEAIEQAGFDSTIMMVLTNQGTHKLEDVAYGPISLGQTAFYLV